jgi:apolipoprotein N-acyltransferase
LISLLLPVITAILFGLSFSPVPPFLRIFIIVAFVPYLYAIFHSKRRTFLTGFLFGILSNAALLWWIGVMNAEGVNRGVIVLGVILLVLLLAVYWGLVALLITRFRNRTLAVFSFPFFWVSLEFIRSLTSELGFPWGSVGYAFSLHPSLIQSASITGLAGISFIILFYNSIIYWSLVQKDWRKGLAGFLVFLVLFILHASLGNFVVSRPPSSQKMRVSLIQPNILPEVKREQEVEDRLSILRTMTFDAAIQGSDLIVWPETAIPCYYRDDSECIRRVKEIVREVSIPVVAGAPEYLFDTQERKRQRYNSAFLIGTEGETVGRYRKIYLVPFGEHLPFDNTFPVLKKIHFGQGDYSPGKEFSVLTDGKRRVCVLICFESIFPRLVKKVVGNGAELIVNITEDSWYGRTSGPYQHAEMAILRAVENRVSVARCGNTGISMLIDPSGRILKRSAIFERTVVQGEVPLRQGTSFYTRYGDVCGWTVVIVSLLLFSSSFLPTMGDFPQRNVS